MNRRDQVFGMVHDGRAEGQSQTYVPAAFFCHFDRSCHTGQAAVNKHIDFFHATGTDLVKIQYERHFPPHEIVRPADWASVKPLDAEFFEPQTAVVRGLVEALKAEAPVIVTLYSPFMCAAHVGGEQALSAHLQEDPDAVMRGLEIVTESLLVFVKECIRAGVDGFYHSTQGGECGRFDDRSLFARAIKPFDLAVMEEIDRQCDFNILHICDYHREKVGGYDDLSPFLDYPGHMVNCSLEIGGKTVTPSEVSRQFGRPFLGGMDRNGPLANCTEEEVRAASREALALACDQFMLGADCTVPNARWDILRTAVDEAHSWGLERTPLD